MATKVYVPRLGEGVDEVTVTKWLKQVGESVNELEPLLEVNTDKVDTEIPAPATGVILQIIAQEGQAAQVGDLLAVIGKAGEAVASGAVASEPVASKTVASEPVASEPVASGAVTNVTTFQPATDLGFISPVVAKIAAEHGVNLSQVTGTGLNGRITKNDVLAYVQNSSPKPSNLPTLERSNVSTLQPATLIKHTSMRKSIAAHMVESKHTSPHVLTVMEADMSKVIKHRAAHKAAFERDGVNLTFTAYFMMAIVAGLKAYPIANSSWSDEGVLIHKAVNLGMATSLGEDGLIVPVIKGADNLSLLAMARSINDLANRARARKLQPDEVKGGTFTLTNHGISGSLFAFPVINQPQCGILGIGAMQKRVVVIDDAIAIRPMVYLSFVFDHRILDGASADWFLTKVKETLENWV